MMEANGNDDASNTVSHGFTLARGARRGQRTGVVLAYDSDLLPGEIGLAAWTRVDRFGYQDFDADHVSRFIEAHSWRFDPKGFCR